MPITVVCPGCMKRFQVSDRFAGKKGPCPKCQTIIDIPKEQVVVHAPEEFVSGGKTIKGRAILKPISRLNTDFQSSHLTLGLVGAIAVFAAAFVLGRWEPGSMPLLRNLIGVFGLIVISFPLVIFGHQLLRDGDALEQLTGRELYRKSGICAAVYVFLWILFEFLSRYLQADTIFIWVYLVPFALFSIIAVHVLFDFDLSRGLLHYLVFFIPLIVLRGMMGLGWIWNAFGEFSSGSGGAPPPPPPPGF